MPRFDAAWIAEMLGLERAAASPPGTLLDLAGVQAGDRVADIGCGPGFLTLPAAQRVGPTGVVWAIDTAPEMTSLVEQRAAEAGLAAIIRPILTAPGQLPLADGAATILFCALLLHDLAPTERLALLGELRRVSVASARLLVLEWQPRPKNEQANRLSPEQCSILLHTGGWRPGAVKLFGVIPRSDGAEGMYAVVAHPSTFTS